MISINIRAATNSEMYENYFIPNNTTLIFIGGVTLDDMVPKVEKYFGHMERKPEPPRYRGREPMPTAEKRLTWRSDELSPRVEVRFQIPGVGHPNRPVFDVLAAALEPHLQSLFVAEGISATVNINTRVVHTERFGVPASINFEVLVSNPAHLEVTEHLLLRELRRLADEPLPDPAVALASKKLRTEWYRTAADPNALAFQIGHFQVMDRWQTLESYLDARDNTSSRDISELIGSYFVAKNRSVGIVTPEGVDE